MTERTDLDWGVARGLAGFRWLALTWAGTVLVLTRDDVGRPALGIALLLAALAITIATTEGALRRRPGLFHPAAVAGELAVGMALLLNDGLVYDTRHGQSLGSAWPIAGILLAAIVAGPVAGTAAGVLLGVARWLGDAIAPFAPASRLALVSSGVLFAIAGGAAGAVMQRVKQAEMALARAQAREEIARELHDGVLQTLAVIQRRAADTDLVALARDQELDLRSYLAGDLTPVRRGEAVPEPTLGAALRAVAARVERRDQLRIEVLLVDEDHPQVSPVVIEAIAGAVGEALTNASKHGGAQRATVFVDVDDTVFCSVKDDGAGFDPEQTPEGLGITASIRGRLTEVGGTVTMSSRPGHGAEVALTAPRSPRSPRR